MLLCRDGSHKYRLITTGTPVKNLQCSVSTMQTFQYHADEAKIQVAIANPQTLQCVQVHFPEASVSKKFFFFFSKSARVLFVSSLT